MLLKINLLTVKNPGTHIVKRKTDSYKFPSDLHTNIHIHTHTHLKHRRTRLGVIKIFT